MRIRFFSNTSNVPGYFPGYMRKVYKAVSRYGDKQRILDIPAGDGVLSDTLRHDGHTVVKADINGKCQDYVYANMKNKLPFSDGEFDTVICLEGLEHLINPLFTVSELCRVCRSGGHVIVSIPNIQNCFSRLHFLCKGYFFQFAPDAARPISNDEVDLGHITPLSFQQIESFFHYSGARRVKITGDRWKAWHLMPLFLAFLFCGLLWITIENGFNKERWHNIGGGLSNLLHPSSLFCRSLILVFERSR